MHGINHSHTFNTFDKEIAPYKNENAIWRSVGPSRNELGGRSTSFPGLFSANDKVFSLVEKRLGTEVEKSVQRGCCYRKSKITIQWISTLKAYRVKRGHWQFRFWGFGHFVDRFPVFVQKKLRFFGFWWLLQFAFLFYFALGFQFSAKIKSGFRIYYSMCGLVFFRFLFGKYAPQSPQPRACLLGFCLRFSVWSDSRWVTTRFLRSNCTTEG